MRLVAAAALAVTLCAASLPAHAAESVELSVKPADINISASYRGTVMHVEGLAPTGSEIVARFTGAAADLALRQKGKVFGLLWMNLGTVHLHNVPSVFLVASSRPLDQINGSELGLAAVRGSMSSDEQIAAHAQAFMEAIKSILPADARNTGENNDNPEHSGA